MSGTQEAAHTLSCQRALTLEERFMLLCPFCSAETANKEAGLVAHVMLCEICCWLGNRD